MGCVYGCVKRLSLKVQDLKAFVALNTISGGYTPMLRNCYVKSIFTINDEFEEKLQFV